MSEHGADVEMQNAKRWEKFRVREYVIADSRTPEQIERDQRLLAEVRKSAFKKRDEREPDSRDSIRRTKPVVLRKPTQTQEQAMQGKAGLDYLPDEACKVCASVPWWNGFRFVRECDAGLHRVDENAALDRAIAKVNSMKPIAEIAMPRLVRSDNDDD